MTRPSGRIHTCVAACTQQQRDQKFQPIKEECCFQPTGGRKTRGGKELPAVVMTSCVAKATKSHHRYLKPPESTGSKKPPDRQAAATCLPSSFPSASSLIHSSSASGHNGGAVIDLHRRRSDGAALPVLVGGHILAPENVPGMAGNGRWRWSVLIAAIRRFHPDWSAQGQGLQGKGRRQPVNKQGTARWAHTHTHTLTRTATTMPRLCCTARWAPSGRPRRA